MSACDCCDELPAVNISLENRRKLRIDVKCGFTSEEEPCAAYSTATTTWSEGDENLIGQEVIVELPSGEPVVWNGGDVVQVEVSEWNPETCSCVATVSGFRPESGGVFEDDPDPVLSNEVSAEEFMENAFACLPEFGEWQTNSEIGLGSIGIYERQLQCNLYQETAGQIRVKHRPSATGYLKIWFAKKTTTWDEEIFEWVSPTYDFSYDSYEWQGGLPNVNASIDNSENLITSDPIPIERPEVNIRTVIFVSKWSLLPGYEPSDPLFDEETSQLVRPIPDCESNAVPTLNEECPFRE